MEVVKQFPLYVISSKIVCNICIKVDNGNIFYLFYLLIISEIYILCTIGKNVIKLNKMYLVVLSIILNLLWWVGTYRTLLSKTVTNDFKCVGIS